MSRHCGSAFNEQENKFDHYGIPGISLGSSHRRRSFSRQSPGPPIESQLILLTNKFPWTTSTSVCFPCPRRVIVHKLRFGSGTRVSAPPRCGQRRRREREREALKWSIRRPWATQRVVGIPHSAGCVQPEALYCHCDNLLWVSLWPSGWRWRSENDTMRCKLFICNSKFKDNLGDGESSQRNFEGEGS